MSCRCCADVFALKVVANIIMGVIANVTWESLPTLHKHCCHHHTGVIAVDVLALLPPWRCVLGRMANLK
jgi:hypothetical protein